jgi:hypothetical protein
MFFQFSGPVSTSRQAVGLSKYILAGWLIVAGLVAMTGCAGLGSSGMNSAGNTRIIVSPANAVVTSGASIQFKASVSGTGQRGVTWIASAGTISPGGLLTTPHVKSPISVVVTAMSVADSQSRATVMVQVAAPDPKITTTALPSAGLGEAYNAILSASGGQLPYKWEVVSGTLPLGLQLNATTGMVSGTATVAGETSFVAGLTDKDGRGAEQRLSLLVSSSSSCGPPEYACSRSDTEVVTAAAPPQLGADPNYYGGHSGAGMVAIDPAYGNRILRVTDGNTAEPGTSFGTPSSAETNFISYDETLFFVTDEGNNPCLFQFDRAAFATTFRGCRHHVGIGSLQFGYTAANNNAFFNYAGPYLYRFVIDRNKWGISADPAFNHGQGHFDPDGPQCLNGQLAARTRQWYVHDTALSSDDSTFIASLGPEQDVDPYIVVWNATKGCRWMNVKTWEVSQGWNTGSANPVKISWVSGQAPTQPGGVHNVQLDRGGKYGVLTINGTSLTSKVFWDLDTSVVNDTCTQCWSHWACDYGVCFWSFGPSGQGFQMRDLAISSSADMSVMPGQRDFVINSFPSDAHTDEHASHANASPDRKNIYLLALQPESGSATVQAVWEDEIIGVNWDGSKRTIRFNKNWNSGYGGFWGSARCPISRQGNYAICTSDYQMYNLDKGFGNGQNQDTCDHNAVGGKGTNGCRGDVLLFELR